MNQWHRIRSILEADDVHTWTKPQKIRIKYFDDKAGKHVTVDHTLHPPKWASGTKPRYSSELEHREAKKHLRSLGVNARIAHIAHIKEEAELEVSGAGEIGTDRLVRKYKKETPGQ